MSDDIEAVRSDLICGWEAEIRDYEGHPTKEKFYRQSCAESLKTFEEIAADAERWRKLVRLLEADDSLRFEEFLGWSILKYNHDPVTMGKGDTLSQAIDSIKE